MQILLEKDPATKIPKECTEDEAAAYAAQGFTVHVMQPDGSSAPFQPKAPEVEAAKAVADADAVAPAVKPKAVKPAPKAAVKKAPVKAAPPAAKKPPPTKKAVPAKKTKKG